MHNDWSGTEIITSPAFGGAFLSVWGCSLIDDNAATTHLRNGVVGLGARMAIDDDDGLHLDFCQRGNAKRPVRPHDLVRIGAASCDGCDSMVEVHIDTGKLNRSALDGLMTDLDMTLMNHPPRTLPGVLAELRAMRFGTDIRTILDRFRAANTLPTGLDAAIARTASTMGRFAADGETSLRRDGIRRLQDVLAGTFPGRALAAAEAAVPKSESDHLVCMFQHTDSHIDAAVAAAPASASVSKKSGFGEVAVAVLPRQLAVHLHADSAASFWTNVPDLAFAAPVAGDGRWLGRQCAVAAQLWADGAEPADAWHAAVAVAH